jgi:drug/metabolite transporter (DMT)-like permease
MTLLAAVFFWQWPTWQVLGWCAAVGIVATTTQLLFNQGLKEADVNVLMPLDFFKLIWASLIGYAFFSEIPSLWTWFGGIMIFASATYVAWRESKAVAPLSEASNSPASLAPGA